MFLSIDNAEKGPGPLSKHARESGKQEQDFSAPTDHDVEANRATAPDDEDARSISEKPGIQPPQNAHLASSTASPEAGLPRNVTQAAA